MSGRTGGSIESNGRRSTSELEDVVVSLGAEEISWARARAASSGQTLSAVLMEALRRFRHSEAQLALDELAAEGITAEDLAAIRAARRSYRP